MASFSPSPGVTTSVIDDSYYPTATSATTPLIVLATEANKTYNGALCEATAESGVIREIVSISESIKKYGIPKFREDSNGNGFHGDCRNEYGLAALNNFLRVGSLAYVVRADVDLADKSESFLGFGVPVVYGYDFTGVGDGTISGITVQSQLSALQTFKVIFVSSTRYYVTGSVSGFLKYEDVGNLCEISLPTCHLSFTVNQGSVLFNATDKFEFSSEYAPKTYVGTGNGKVRQLQTKTLARKDELWTVSFTSATSFTVTGSLSGAQGSGTVGQLYSNNYLQFMISAGSTAFVSGNVFTIEIKEYERVDPLGSTNAQKKLSIVTALQALINTNEEIRQETKEYNLILCPGYEEVVDELYTLSQDPESVRGEAFIIADTPSNYTPEQISRWATSTSRVRHENIAYYYPWGLSSNLDGANIVIPPSAAVLRTFAYNDEVEYPWMAPAGIRRGMELGLTSIGYISGTLGEPTTYIETALKQGHRDSLYTADINPISYFPNTGIVVWGQKTSAPAESALDRINVVRCICDIRRKLRKGAMPYVFQPANTRTMEELKSMANSILGEIASREGLEDYAVYCDKTINTPSVIDKNQLILKVAIIPTKAAEFIGIDINVLSQGASV